MTTTIENILLDYDNTMGKSESKAFEACCAWLNECLAKYGVARRFTVRELMDEFIGASFRRMITELSSAHSFNFSNEDLEAMVLEEEQRVIAKLGAELEAAPGINPVLASLFGKYRLAVVSSSALRRLRVCLKKAEQEEYFDPDHVFSAASSLATPTSKPKPDIYNHALKVLDATPQSCVAVEDSKNGVLSADAADILVVGYVGCHEEHEREHMAQVLTDAGAACIMHHWDEFPAILSKIEAGEIKRPQRD